MMNKPKEINHEKRIVERKKALESSYISKMEGHKFNRTAVKQMIGGLCHSFSRCKEINYKIKIMCDNMIRQFEIDYSDNTKKPLLKPINNREYWLFTETHQMLKDFQKKVGELNE